MRIFLTLFFILSFPALAAQKVHFYGEITPRTLTSLEARILKAVAKFGQGADRTVVVEIDSGGGNLFATFSFVERIQQVAADQNFVLATRVHHSCESSCTVLFTAGSIRQASRWAEFGFHSPAVASRIPKGMKEDDILQHARNRWLEALGRVDLPLSFEIDHRGYLLNREMSYMSGKELATGYVSELVR